MEWRVKSEEGEEYGCCFADGEVYEDRCKIEIVDGLVTLNCQLLQTLCEICY